MSRPSTQPPLLKSVSFHGFTIIERKSDYGIDYENPIAVKDGSTRKRGDRRANKMTDRQIVCCQEYVPQLRFELTFIQVHLNLLALTSS